MILLWTVSPFLSPHSGGPFRNSVDMNLTCVLPGGGGSLPCSPLPWWPHARRPLGGSQLSRWTLPFLLPSQHRFSRQELWKLKKYNPLLGQRFPLMLMFIHHSTNIHKYSITLRHSGTFCEYLIWHRYHTVYFWENHRWGKPKLMN